VGALARLGLARACALEGDTAKSRAAYEDFLTLWKDADPDIPYPEASQGGVREAEIACTHAPGEPVSLFRFCIRPKELSDLKSNECFEAIPR